MVYQSQLLVFVNIGQENRTGFEFTLNYTPYKWWKLNSNFFNAFRVQTKGDFFYPIMMFQTI